MQIQANRVSSVVPHFEEIQISQNQTCLEKIKEWFKHAWNSISQAFRSCCSINKTSIKQIPTAPIRETQLSTQTQPRQPEPERPRLGEPIEDPDAERNAILNELDALPQGEPPLNAGLAVTALIERNRQLAERAAIGMYSFTFHNVEAINGRAREVLHPGNWIHNAERREQEGIPDVQYRQFLHVCNALLTAPMRTFELQHAFLITHAKTNCHWLLSHARENGRFAAWENHLVLARACLNMAHACEDRNAAAVDREAEVLARIGDRFRNPHNWPGV